MAKQKPSTAGDIDQLLEEILVDSYGDDEQLWALHQAFSGCFELPMDAHVVGEPLSLLAVDYDGNARPGLTARCRRDDGSECRVALADVELAPRSAGYLYLAAYCKWLGIEPAAQRSLSPRTKARTHKAVYGDIDLSRPVEVVVLAVKQRAARCRMLDSGRVITLRAQSLHRIVPGQIPTIQPRKQWRHAGHPYLSGRIVASRIDAAALGLAPLALHEFGRWDPAEEYWGEEDEPVEPWAKAMIARGPRPMFEMEQVHVKRWGGYLAGGTAVALRLGHRRSVDLDYFTRRRIDVTSLTAVGFRAARGSLS